MKRKTSIVTLAIDNRAFASNTNTKFYLFVASTVPSSTIILVYRSRKKSKSYAQKIINCKSEFSCFSPCISNDFFPSSVHFLMSQRQMLYTVITSGTKLAERTKKKVKRK